MSKAKAVYACHDCGAQFLKWSGQCPDCDAWNSIHQEAVRISQNKNKLPIGYAGLQSNQVQNLDSIQITHENRYHTKIKELDRVLGGGLVAGSVVLTGGDPGIGKSTILLQTLCELSQDLNCLYVTGEESLQQVAMRAKRLELPRDKLSVLTETCVETILDIAVNQKPKIMVIDSIQTLFTDTVSSAPGSVSQVRETAQQLVRYAKQSQCAVFLVGHVTKEGALAGPRVLEHMVDTVLYFEGQSDNRFRVIRAVKNRFGAVNELGIFAMTDKGLKEVNNPSAIFLTNSQETPGSAIMVTWEGSRPLLVEIQALVDSTQGNYPKRVATGLDQNRLAMLLAVLNRHGGIATVDQDVFVNAVGGVKVSETAADLPILLAAISSLRNKVLNKNTAVFGEVGLAGEIRPVQSGQERLKELAKHGFKRAIVPKANAPKKPAYPGLEIIAVENLGQAIEQAF